MKFYIEKWNKPYRQEIKYPCVIIENNGWNDYDYETLFQIYFCEKNYRNKEHLGDVKILSKKSKLTMEVMPEQQFQKLNDQFCSLGQSIDYYRKIYSLGLEVSTFILENLNDVIFNEKYYELFKCEDGFTESLLRNSEAARIIENRKEIINDIDFKGNQIFSFTYTTQLPCSDGVHKLDLNFSKIKDLPNRINCIVGKNGTGKTTLLSEMATSIKLGEKTKFSDIPKYSKIIAVSYSVFDEFFNPKENQVQGDSLKEREINEAFNYIYCGLRDDDKTLNQEDLKAKFKNSVDEITIRNRKDKWFEIFGELFEDKDSLFLEDLFEGKDINLSSGQNILLSIFTEVIANIEPESLLLLDEPEIHLHPNAISNLMRMINKLLEEFNSYCIISTHSPLVLQEIPSRYVSVFERYGNIPSIKRLTSECFGDNISNIINNVFRVSQEESNYQTILQKIYNDRDIEYIVEMFDNKLSFNALTFLDTLEYLKESK